jgi:TRAP-type C4-dicarboxylate transport system permease small subunit
MTTLLWNFLSAVVVVAMGGGIARAVRADPPGTAEEFANYIFLGVLWCCVFGVVLLIHLKS